MKLLFTVIVILCSYSASAQMGKLTGKVFDEKGEVIFGASVIYRKDVTIGAVTDENGNYQLVNCV